MKQVHKKAASRLVSLLLALTLVCGMAPAALAAAGMSNFQSSNTYVSGQFTDVTAGSWYEQSVKTAYELGLVLGTSDTSFSPDANITLGSAVALAARLHSIYQTGQAAFVQGNPWYQGYVDYAVSNGIITAGQFSDYNANATRRQFAAILAKALPSAELTAINTIADGAIPDLAAGSANYADIYTLYRAGVLTGSDQYGTFNPETTIGRSSVAAIVARMAVPSLRQHITLTAPVTQIPVSSIALSQTSLSLTTGGSATLTATVSPATATDKTVSWSSSNPSVVSVSNGTVTALAAGTASIAATASNGITAQCTVTVTAPAPVQPTVSSYPGFPGVPDFGSVLGISALVDTADSGDDSMGWFYTSSSMERAGHGEDFAELYGAALSDCGFSYLTDFENDDGGTTLVYTNGTYVVMWGVTIIGGMVGIMVVVTPE